MHFAEHYPPQHLQLFPALSRLAGPCLPVQHPLMHEGMDRRRFLLGLSCLALGLAPIHRNAADERTARKRRCKRLAERIRHIESRLRMRHSGKTGRRLREQARELQLKRFRQCR